MSPSRLVAMSVLALPSFVLAANTFNVASSSCSGALASSYTDGVSLACTGDLFLSQGVIESETSILISATGSLQLTEVALSSPTITLRVGRFLTLDAETTFKVPGGNPVLGTPLLADTALLRAAGGLELHQRQTSDAIQWESFDIASGSTVHFVQPGTIQMGVVPEPGSVVLVMAGLMCIGLARRS